MNPAYEMKQLSLTSANILSQNHISDTYSFCIQDPRNSLLQYTKKERADKIENCQDITQ
jgi:hypothetical protein